MLLLPAFPPEKPLGTNDKPLVSFQNDIFPIIQTRCALNECHRGRHDPALLSYERIAAITDRIKFRLEYKRNPMPPIWGPSRLDSTERAKILFWIEKGAMNN
jgi:hypothetical protein